MPAARRVFAGVSASPGSVLALRQAADLAHHQAILIPLLTWLPPDGDIHERKHPWAELRQLWEDDAWQRLWDTLDRAFGGLPAGVTTQPVVLRGKPGTVLTGLARQPGDLSRYCLAHAHCPVLAIPPPALAEQAGHGLRGWAWRHRLHLDTAQPT